VALDRDVLRLGGAASHKWIVSARNAGPKLAWAGIDEISTGAIEDRDLEALRSKIEGTRIQFHAGSSTIEPGQARLIYSVIPGLRQWTADERADGRVPRIKVIGHADRTGSDITNSTLRNQRARHVMELLVAGGIPSDSLTAIGGMYIDSEAIAGAETPESASLRNVMFELSSGPEPAGREKR
jgi:outer membrane protein OmpA-like peptidoglycan-associated protein